MGASRPGRDDQSNNFRDSTADRRRGRRAARRAVAHGFGAFVPLALAFALPRVAQPYLFTLDALLVLCGIVMLVRQERRKVIDVRG
jgi:hypothetical protein